MGLAECERAGAFLLQAVDRGQPGVQLLRASKAPGGLSHRGRMYEAGQIEASNARRPTG
jgi:hypothetical protein